MVCNIPILLNECTVHSVLTVCIVHNAYIVYIVQRTRCMKCMYRIRWIQCEDCTQWILCVLNMQCIKRTEAVRNSAEGSSVYIYMHIYTYTSVYICIHREREREREPIDSIVWFVWGADMHCPKLCDRRGQDAVMTSPWPRHSHGCGLAFTLAMVMAISINGLQPWD